MDPSQLKNCQEFLRLRGHTLLSLETSGLAELIGVLVHVLVNDKNEYVLEKAAYYLGLIGSAAEPAIIPLSTIIATNPVTPTPDDIEFNLDRNVPWICSSATWRAMEAMKQIGPERGIEAIRPLCHDLDPQVRFRAVLALQKIGEPADRIIPCLVNLLRDLEWKIRRATVLALWPYQTFDNATFDTLLALTTDPDSIVRLRVDYLLGSKLPMYQRRYREGITNLVDLLQTAVEGDMPTDVIQTVPMMGTDAPLFVEQIMVLLCSKVSLSMPAMTAITFVLRDIVCHFPSLKKSMSSSLGKIAVPGNQAACIVNATLKCELSRLEVEGRNRVRGSFR